MSRYAWVVVAASLLSGCSPPSSGLGRCRASPEVEGKRVAEEAFVAFIAQGQEQPQGSSMYEVTAGIDPNNLEYLGMPAGEPGDLLMYQFRAAGKPGLTFNVLVSDDCRTEVNWH
ncbi:MAG: hypothetical protein JNM59_08245 [Hyphomonadaceae bacterium]|nr:hypothetical protein [Hyphomonadaceae bacterium]